MSPHTTLVHFLPSLVFIEVNPSAVARIDPGTFGSQARSSNHVATAAAFILPSKLRVILDFLLKLRICLRFVKVFAYS